MKLNLRGLIMDNILKMKPEFDLGFLDSLNDEELVWTFKITTRVACKMEILKRNPSLTIEQIG